MGGFNDVVQVHVLTDPPVEGVSVYFEAFDPDDPSACPGNAVELSIEGTCAPDCKTMSLTGEIVEAAYQQFVTVGLSANSVDCGAATTPILATISILPSAPSGVATVRVRGEIQDAGQSVCITTVDAAVTVLELVITETPPTYLPENSNAVNYTATIQPGGGVDVIRFELSSVSDFPGDAMNHGTQSDTDPDLKFEGAGNPGFTITSNQMTATTTGAVANATVAVTAYDFGAQGSISATLDSMGCVSETKGIPLDSDADSLPDAYENMQPDKDANMADTDGDGVDDGIEDDDPDRAVVADAGPNYQGARTSLGLTGDGLVAFEEYRGFFTMGSHTRTLTGVKEVFAGVDENVGGVISLPAGQKLEFFSNLTGFQVHEVDGTNQPLEWELATRPVINWQRGGIPGVTDQRAILIVRNDTISGFGLTSFSGIPNQSPNETQQVEINVAGHVPGMPGVNAGPDGMLCTADDANHTLTATEAMDALRETVGHECAHGCHVEHNFCRGDRHIIPENQGHPNSLSVDTGAAGLCETVAAGDDIQIVPIGQGAPNAVIVTDGGDGLHLSPTGDDTVQGNTITAGPDGIAQTIAAGNDVQVVPVGQGVPNSVVITDGGDGLQSSPQGDDTVQGSTITAGPDGVTESSASGNDTQVIPVGQGQPFGVIITDGGNGLQLSPAGDDTVQGSTIVSGVNGVCETSALGNDVQVIPVGEGLPNSNCVNTGDDGISQSWATGDDVQRIPVGLGEPHRSGIDDGGDGVLDTMPSGDDQVVGLTITTGADGILQSFADINTQGVTSIITSDVLVPVPNTYSTDDLNQVRLHLKHP